MINKHTYAGRCSLRCIDRDLHGVQEGLVVASTLLCCTLAKGSVMECGGKQVMRSCILIILVVRFVSNC